MPYEMGMAIQLCGKKVQLTAHFAGNPLPCFQGLGESRASHESAQGPAESLIVNPGPLLELLYVFLRLA